MKKRPQIGPHGVWAGLLSALLLAACGGGSGQPSAPPAPKAALSIQLHGPSQVRTGEALQINGSLDLGGADLAKMEWQLLERPAGSQATLPSGAGSSQLLNTDRPGRYVVQWTVASADGASAQRQLVVEAVDGPLIQTASTEGQIQLGKPTLLQASQPVSGAQGLPTYRWTLLQGPSGSQAQLSGAWGPEVSLKADVAGQYQVQVESHQGDNVTKTIKTLSAPASNTAHVLGMATCSGFLGCTKLVGQPVVLKPYVYSGSLGNAKVQYQWTLTGAPPNSQHSRQLGNSETLEFTPDVAGMYMIMLNATSPDVEITSGSTAFIPVISKLPTGTIEAPRSVSVGQLVPLDASANRSSDGRPLTSWQHLWTVVKAPGGNNAVVDAGNWGNPIGKFRPDVPGDYVINLGFEGVPNYATFALTATSTDPWMVYPPKLTLPISPLVPGEEFQFKAESSSEAGQTIVHEWNFGDGTKVTGNAINRSYAYPGVYQVQVIARDTSTQRIARQLATVTVVANRLNNIPPAPCKDTACPAAAADRYAGKGTGRWQLVNDQPHPQAVNIDITGVSAGQQVLVSLLNATGASAGDAELGKSVGMVPRPRSSTLTQTQAYQASMTQLQGTVQHRHDEAHAEHLARDRALKEALPGSSDSARAAAGRRVIQSATPRAPLPVPALGSSRDWRDADGGLIYKSRLVDSCSLPSGRNVLFWLDEQARVNELLGPTQIADDLKPMACGANGGFQRLQKLLDAEVFGLHSRSDIISDAALQPVQILLADPGAQTGWGAYVYGGDLALKSYWPLSNEAVLMVVNARYIKTDLNFIKSSLVHEFMHQINNYQRWVLNAWGSHESWLEETTAMMAEDLVSSTLITKADGSRFAAMASRMAAHQSSAYPGQYLGGSGANYSVGGSLAGYLNRRLGAHLLRGLTFKCSAVDQTPASLRCLDTQVFQLSGKGLTEHYSAMNLSVIGALNAEDSLDMGAPAYVDNEVDLPRIDLKTLEMGMREQLVTPWRLYAGAHIYQWESVTSSADGRYRRKGIMVPPGHVLQIVIR